MLAGTLVAGVFALLWQAVAAHSLGAQAFAPVATCWTVAYLASTVIAFPIESWAAKTTAVGIAGRRRLADALPRVAALILVASCATFLATLLAARSLFHGKGLFAAVCGFTVLAFSLIGLLRGSLAGEGSFSAYGILTALDAATRVALVGVAATLGGSALEDSLTIPLAACVALLWVRRVPAPTLGADRHGEPPDVVAFLTATIAAGGASQVILTAGPVVLAGMGGSQTDVTVLFVTLTLARSLLFVATPIASRLMPSLTRRIVAEGRAATRRLAIRVAGLAIGATAVGGLLGAVLWPAATDILFGAKAGPALSAVAVAGTVLAVAGLALSQVLVASGRPRPLVVSWWVALGVGGAWLVVGHGPALWRCVIAFAVAEAVAVALLTAISVARAESPPMSAGADQP